jgi:hypothetical protein
VELSPTADTTLEDLLMHDLSPHQEAVDRVSESAAKEYQIEAALDKVTTTTAILQWASSTVMSSSTTKVTC